MLYVEVMYHFNEQVDFKISSKFNSGLKVLKLFFCEISLYLCKVTS